MKNVNPPTKNKVNRIYLAYQKQGQVVLKPVYPDCEPFGQETKLIQGPEAEKIVATADIWGRSQTEILGSGEHEQLGRTHYDFEYQRPDVKGQKLEIDTTDLENLDAAEKYRILATRLGEKSTENYLTILLY